LCLLAEFCRGGLARDLAVLVADTGAQSLKAAASRSGQFKFKPMKISEANLPAAARCGRVVPSFAAASTTFVIALP
jgi:hypothetical protein